MAAEGQEEVYATLLLSDTYLPGALVLARSLLDNGTTRKLAVLVTEDTVSRESISHLQSVFHHVISVPRIRNERPHNLQLMDRADLHSAFTKIALWKLTQFSKIVYIDADILTYRAPDELFDIDAPFSAAPDIGWPDIFNSGVMVLKPDISVYNQLLAMAERGVSFDGADQGLLNMYFGQDYNRISFTYNVTPSAHYQYIPAYKHFQSRISMVHFIGVQKPWFQGRPAAPTPTNTNEETQGPSTPHDNMVSKWWNVYDWHYGQEQVEAESTRRPTTPEQPAPSTEYVKYLVKGEFDPHEHRRQPSPARHGHHVHFESDRGDVEHRPASHQENQRQPSVLRPEHDKPGDPVTERHEVHRAPEPEATHRDDIQQQVQHRHEPPPMAPTWDAQWQPPPPNSKPEAASFPDTRYEMSRDRAHFVPPQRYPSPPRNMWYEVPKEPRAAPTEKPKPIFPWESHQPPPTRVFAEDVPQPRFQPHFQPQSQPTLTRAGAEQPKSPSRRGGMKKTPQIQVPPRLGGQPLGPTTPIETSASLPDSPRSVRFAESSDDEFESRTGFGPEVSAVIGTSSVDQATLSSPDAPPGPSESEPSQPAFVSEEKEKERVTQPVMSDYWASPSAANAWDEVPGIRKYIERVIDQTGLGGPRRVHAPRRRAGTSDKDAGLEEDMAGEGGTHSPRHSRQGFFKITDFPSADDRPSLPVTPAPGARGGDFDNGSSGAPPDSAQLPEAEGVPRQSDWDPVEQLARLASFHHVDPEALLRRLSAEEDVQAHRAAHEYEHGLGNGAARGGGGSMSGERNIRRARDVPKREMPASAERLLTPLGLGIKGDHDRTAGRTRDGAGAGGARGKRGADVEVEVKRGEPAAILVAPVPVRAGIRASKAGSIGVTTGSGEDASPVVVGLDEAAIAGKQGVPGLRPHRRPLPSPRQASGREPKGDIKEEKSKVVEKKQGVTKRSEPKEVETRQGKGVTRGGGIPVPSYGGPGAAWEKGADVPRNVTSALPTEEEKDVLET